jgi:hypothetical protein
MSDQPNTKRKYKFQNSGQAENDIAFVRSGTRDLFTRPAAEVQYEKDRQDKNFATYHFQKRRPWEAQVNVLSDEQKREAEYAPTAVYICNTHLTHTLTHIKYNG